VKQNRPFAYDHVTADALSHGASLAEIFAYKQLAETSSPAVPAVEIVMFDRNQKKSSSDVLPLSRFFEE
jgi:hypothetical protein